MQIGKYRFGILQCSLALFFLVTPIESLPIAEGFSIVKLSALIVILAWAIKGFHRRTRSSARVFLPLLFYAIVSCLWSIDTATSINAVITFLLPSVLIALILDSSITSKKDISFFLAFYIVGCMIASIAGLLTRQQTLAAATFAGEERLSAFGQDQNTLAFLLIMGAIPLFKSITSAKSKYMRFLAITILVIFSFMIISTGSRTGVLVYAFTGVIYLVSTKKFKILIGSGLLIAVILPILLQYIPESIVDRLFQTAELVSDGNFSERGEIWSSAVRAFSEENIILGVGYSNFSTMLRQHFGWQMASHNTYLTYFTEFGILGIWTFIYILVKIVKTTLLIKKQERSIYIYCYIVPIFIFMLTLETEYKRWIFIIWILLSAWERLNEEEYNSIFL